MAVSKKILNIMIMVAVLIMFCTSAVSSLFYNLNAPPEKNNTFNTTDTEGEIHEPVHKKFITKGNDGLYNLTLDVKGDHKTIVSTPVDIVILFDFSSSTSTTMVDCFKKAAKEMVKILLNEINASLEPELQHRISIMEFTDTARSVCGFLSDPDELNGFIDNLNAGSSPNRTSTSWSNALAVANNYLKSPAGRENSEKYILFQTDGHPNYPSDSYSESFRYPFNRAYENALNILNNDVTIYSIAALRDPNDSNYEPFMYYIDKDFSYPVTSSDTFLETPASSSLLTAEAFIRKAYIDSGRSSEMGDKFFAVTNVDQTQYTNAFRRIAAEISQTETYLNITITDKLSKYVSFENSVDSGGNILDAVIKKVSDESEETIDNYILTYNESSHEVIFKINEILEHNATYSVTFSIKPSQAAYDDFESNKNSGQYKDQYYYPHKGEIDTGSTSDNIPGFFTNEEATLSYYVITIDGGYHISDEINAAPYNKPVIQLDTAPVPPDDEPEHKKYIDAKDDKSFSLTLDVKGDSKQLGSLADPIDIVIAFDVSGSTSTDMIISFQEATRAMMNILLTEKNSEKPEELRHRIAIIDFNQQPLLICDFTSDPEVLESHIQTIIYRPLYTSWNRAINFAHTLLNTGGRTDSDKYLLFLSDGHPNRPLSDTSEGTLYPYNLAYSAAYDLIKDGITIYSLAALEGTNDFVNDDPFMFYIDKNTSHPLSRNNLFLYYPSSTTWLSMEAMTHNAYINAGRGSDAENKFFVIRNDTQSDYIEAFENIAKDISKVRTYKDVTITDKLSKYTTLLNSCDADGNILGASVMQVSENGTESLFTGDYELTYDPLNHLVIFKINEQLEHGITYYARFDIAPSQLAYDELAVYRNSGNYSDNRGYPHIGGANTGTSSDGIGGFFSNDYADIKYYVVLTNDDVSVSEEMTGSLYEKPVIQVELSKITVNKVWENVPESYIPDSIDLILYRNGTSYRSLTVDSDDGWQAVFDDLPGGVDKQIYTIEEIELNDFETSYSKDKIEFTGRYAQEDIITVTNTLLSGDLIIHKTDRSLLKLLPDAEFDLYKADENWNKTDKITNYQITTNNNGEFIITKLQYGRYILIETKAPPGYMLSTEETRVEFNSSNNQVNIINVLQPVLPLTGGSGTVLIYLFGLILIFESFLLFYYIKNSYKKEDINHES